MKSLVCLGLLILAAECAPPPFLVKPANDAVVNVLVADPVPSDCSANMNCDALKKCRAALATLHVPFTLVLEATVDNLDVQQDKSLALEVGANSTACDVDFEVEKFEFSNLSGCNGAVLPVKVIEKGGVAVLAPTANDKIFATALGTSDSELSVQVRSKLPGNKAYYFKDAKCVASSDKYMANVEWRASFGPDNKRVTVPTLATVSNISLTATADCTPAGVLATKPVANDPFTLVTAVSDLVNMGIKQADCSARLDAEISAPATLLTLNQTGLPEAQKVLGFRIIAVSNYMTITSLKFDSDPKCDGNSSIFLSSELSDVLPDNASPDAWLVLDISRQRLVPDRPLEVTESLFPFAFIKGCDSLKTITAEVQWRIRLPNPKVEDAIIVNKLAQAPVPTTVNPTMKPSSTCADICKTGTTLADCMTAADAVTSKDCSVELSWTGQVVAKGVERIDDGKLGIGMGFSVDIGKTENISNLVFSGFSLASAEKTLIADNSPVTCDFAGTPKVVGKTKPNEAGKFVVTFDEPVPVAGDNLVGCFIPSLAKKTLLDAATVDWNVSGVFAAAKDADKLVPIDYLMTNLTGSSCDVSFADHFLLQTKLETASGLAGCKGSEEVTLLSARSYLPLPVETKTELYPRMTLDPASFPAGKGSWSLVGWNVKGLKEKCFNEGGTLVELKVANDTGKATIKSTLVTLKKDEFEFNKDTGVRILESSVLPHITSKIVVTMIGKTAGDCSTTDNVQSSIIIARDLEFNAAVGPTVKPGPATTTPKAAFSPVYLLPLSSAFLLFFLA